MGWLRVDKYGRGFHDTFYAYMPKNKKMRHKRWKCQLQEWGDNTAGGFNYGYNIYVRSATVRRLKIKGRKTGRLKLNPNNLEAR